MACHLVRVEFRHQSWFGGERTVSTLAFEFELGEVHTVVDGPRGFSNSVPAIWEGSHPRFALLRLHGRNTSTWNVKGASAAFDRFNYHCSDPEPDEVARQLAQLATEASTMHVVFNNNIEDQGQCNAASLQVRLASLGPA